SGKFVAMRAKANSAVSIYNFTSIQGPQFTINAPGAIIDTVYIDGQSLVATFSTGLTAVNAPFSGLGAITGGDTDSATYYENAKMASMSSGFLTGQTYTITDSVLSKDGSIGLIPNATDIRCSGSPDGIMTERKRNPEVIKSRPFLSIGFIAPQANNTAHPAINIAP
ncbi:MAG: hypothetical protein L3J69_15470, partial [Desulfobacula sp.]|nr:hypothetical protein [Desulfobacula sp.]